MLCLAILKLFPVPALYFILYYLPLVLNVCRFSFLFYLYSNHFCSCCLDFANYFRLLRRFLLASLVLTLTLSVSWQSVRVYKSVTTIAGCTFHLVPSTPDQVRGGRICTKRQLSSNCYRKVADLSICFLYCQTGRPSFPFVTNTHIKSVSSLPNNRESSVIQLQIMRIYLHDQIDSSFPRHVN